MEETALFATDRLRITRTRHGIRPGGRKCGRAAVRTCAQVVAVRSMATACRRHGGEAAIAATSIVPPVRRLGAPDPNATAGSRPSHCKDA
jgi:hypothetical protein